MNDEEVVDNEEVVDDEVQTDDPDNELHPNYAGPVFTGYFYNSDGVEEEVGTAGYGVILEQTKLLGDANRGYKIVDSDGVVVISHTK